MQLANYILLVGPPDMITKELTDIVAQRGYHLHLVVQPDSREELVYALNNLPIKPQIVIFGGFKWFGQLNEEIFGPLVLSLKLVCGRGAGYETVDIDYLTKHGVYYANTPKAVAEPTASTATMLILQTVRAASQAEASVRAGKWTEGLTPTPDFRGLLVGIIGMGSIGKLVRDKVQAFGMKVIYNNRHRLSPEEEGNAKFVTFKELLKQARVITLHCPLTPETHHLLSDNEFEEMQPNVFIVNTSRGPVIDEEALVRAMKSGKVLRVGLDVYEAEPIVHPWLRQSDRASLLPHWAGQVDRMPADIEAEQIANTVSWIDHGVPKTPVNEPGQASQV